MSYFRLILYHVYILIQIRYQNKSMSSNKLQQLFRLPFLKSYNSGSRNFITVAKVHTFLGTNFYTRLNTIYSKLIQSIARKNYRELQTMLQPNFANKIMSQIKSAEDGRFKFRIHLPQLKVTMKRKKLQRLLTVRESIWNTGLSRIGIQCNVYFGQKFSKEDPLKLSQQDRKSKIYRVGQFRYLRYYEDLGLLDNIKNWYNEQTYELLVKYSSKMYLQVQHFDEQSNITTDPETQIMTQITMRTGNRQFDWIITDINNLK